MKLSIKKKYFDLIKSGIKLVELRDAHITFICEETGEELRKDVLEVVVNNRSHYNLPKDIEFDDDYIMCFYLSTTP